MQQDDGPAVARQEGLEDGRQRLEVLIDLPDVEGIGRPDLESRYGEEARWQPSEVPLRADVGAGPDQHIESIFLRQL